MDIYEWVAYGVERGYCTEVVCQTHDGAKLTDTEQDEFEEGDDPCVPILRIWTESRPGSPPPLPATGSNRDAPYN